MSIVTASAIIPTCNRVELLPRAVRSVLAQTFQDFELIIVDDASTDDTPAVAHSFQSADPRVRYARHPVNQGLSAARNTGVAMAKGEFIAFLDDDDEWLPSKLEAQLAVFRNSAVSQLGLVDCGTILVDATTGTEMGRIPARKRGYLLGDLLDANFITGGGSTPMVRKQAFDACGAFDTADVLRYGGAEDWEMWLRIAYRYSFDFTGEILTKYYVRTRTALTQRDLDWANNGRACDYVLHKHRALFTQYPRSASNALYRVGNLYLFGAMVSRGRKHFLEALRYNPGNLRAWLSLGASLFGSRFYRWAYEVTLPVWGNPDSRTPRQAILRDRRRSQPSKKSIGSPPRIDGCG